MNKLKLEVGKSYRTIGGTRIDIIEEHGGKECLYIGKWHSGLVPRGFKSDGKWRGRVIGVSDLDLIAEWQDEPDPSILQEAEKIINGDRAEAYGDAKEGFENIAKGWSVIFGKEVTARQVGLAMAWLKICRENNNHKRDNLVDLAGYAALIEKL